MPLVRRAYENWNLLEQRSGTTLFQRTGGLMLGAPESGLVRGTLESASLHGIDVESLDPVALARRFPALRPAESMIGILEQRAGILFPEACVSAHLSLAFEEGAEVRTGTRVISLAHEKGGIAARTREGVIRARRLVMCAGPWTRPLLSTLGVTVPLEIERQTMHWFARANDSAQLGPDHLPITMVQHDGERLFYLMPDLGDGVKAAIHYEGARVTAETVDRVITAADTAPVRELMHTFVPHAAGAIRESAVCLYTRTPDLDFIIDAVHGVPNAVVISACSGHGFKFASAIGEVAAQLSLGEQPDIDVSHFGASRFA